MGDTDGASQIFCVGEIYRDHKNSGCFQTKAVSNCVNPVWNHEHLWTEYEEGDRVVFTVFANTMPDAILGRTELGSSQFCPQPFEGELPLAHAGEGATATLTVKVALLDEAVPFVVERVTGPMRLHDLLRPQDAPHQCSEPERTSQIKQPVAANEVPLKFTVATPMAVHQFYNTDHVHRSKPIGVVGAGRRAPSAPTVVRGPVRAVHAAVPPPCATMPAGTGRLTPSFPGVVGGTGRLTPSFPLRTSGAIQPRGVVYHYGHCTPPVQVVAAPTMKLA